MPKTDLWLHDVQWDTWHAWPLAERMDGNGRARTACGDDFYWSATVKTSYHVLVTVGCYLCRLALEGTPVKRKGRPRRLPDGPPKEPRPVGRPARPKPVEVVSTPKTPTTGPKSRTEKLIDAGAKPITYTRPDGRVVHTAHPNAVTRAKIAAADVNELDDVPSFEVGRRLPAWECMRCGTVLAFGDRYCSDWCASEDKREAVSERIERDGLVAARLHFEDVLYRRPRRDSIKAWSPPVSQIRKEYFPRGSY